MKNYELYYSFDGEGTCKIKAKNKMEAEQKWRDGEFLKKNEEEWGDDYRVDEVIEQD